MELGIAGRCAIVTGASKGIGRATAEMLVHEGAMVVLAARERGPLDQLRNELPRGADPSVERECERILGVRDRRVSLAVIFGGMSDLKEPLSPFP